MAMRSGTIKTMFFAGGLMAVTNLLFAVLAWTGKSEVLFAFAVIADDINSSICNSGFCCIYFIIS